MPRKPRICIHQATHHTTSRCIEKKSLMKSNKVKELMLQVLNLTMKKYHFNLISYTIMDNHFHFFIKTLDEGENISRIMQFIKSQFARRYNRMMDRTGPFWNERFSDTIIELTTDPPSTFFNILLYIGYNPVRSNYIADPRDYAYSSFKCYIDESHSPPVKITFHEYFLQLGDTFKERANIFLLLEEKYRKRIFPESLFA
jgi:putative transposase